MSHLFDGVSDAGHRKLRKRSQPQWTRPMLAVLTDAPFSDPDWIYERKLDGVRCLVFRNGKRVRIASRNRKTMNASWPELVADLEAQPRDDFIADGEIVAFSGNRTSFSRLQNRIGIRKAEDARRTGIGVYLYLFDVLHLAGRDVTQLALRERKALLRRALSFAGRIRYTPHRNERGESFLAEACRKGWEGLIAKDARTQTLAQMAEVQMRESARAGDRRLHGTPRLASRFRGAPGRLLRRGGPVLRGQGGHGLRR